MGAGSNQRTRLRWGLGCTIVLSAFAGLVWGRDEAEAAAALAAIATLLQLLAAWRQGRSGMPASPDILRVYLIGAMLRLAGVVLLGVLVTMDPRTFPPLPSALGFLGTILTMLYLETRLGR